MLPPNSDPNRVISRNLLQKSEGISIVSLSAKLVTPPAAPGAETMTQIGFGDQVQKEAAGGHHFWRGELGQQILRYRGRFRDILALYFVVSGLLRFLPPP